MLEKVVENKAYRTIIKPGYGIMESTVLNEELLEPLVDLKTDVYFRVKALNGSKPKVLLSDNVSKELFCSNVPNFYYQLLI